MIGETPDYNQAFYTFTCARKHLFKSKIYQAYIFDTMLVIAEAQKDRKPKYIVKFGFNVQIGWVVERKKTNEVIFKAFTFRHNKVVKDVLANSDDLLNMKLLLSNKLTYYKISDFYEPQYYIGRGSSARVVLCRSFIDNQYYAVKTIEKSYLQQQARGLEQFQCEIQIMRTLSVYNTKRANFFLTLYETFEGDYTYYLSFDLMEGKSLQQEFERIRLNENRQSFTVNEARTIIKQLLEGIKIIHDAGIIHRDLKFDNIMFAKKGDYSSLRIVDFGLATFQNVEQYMYPKCGTPGYVAPEILNLPDRNTKYGQACDIFSAGCILYKLLIGKNVFPGNQFKEVLKINKICKIDFRSPEFLSVSDYAYDLLHSMLQVDPNKRITAAEALQHNFFTEEEQPDLNKIQNFNQQQVIDFLGIEYNSQDSCNSPFGKLSKKKHMMQAQIQMTKTQSNFGRIQVQKGKVEEVRNYSNSVSKDAVFEEEVENTPEQDKRRNLSLDKFSRRKAQQQEGSNYLPNQFQANPELVRPQTCEGSFYMKGSEPGVMRLDSPQRSELILQIRESTKESQPMGKISLFKPKQN